MREKTTEIGHLLTHSKIKNIKKYPLKYYFYIYFLFLLNNRLEMVAK